MDIKSLLPNKVRRKVGAQYRTFYGFWHSRYTFANKQRSYKKKLSSIKGKKKIKIKVAFLLENRSVWKYEYLYFLLKSNKRFEPVVFICPFKTYGERIMQEEMEATNLYFKEKGYEVVKTLNKDHSLLDVKESFKPDMVFFTTPWKHSYPQYRFHYFDDSLTCYVPYSFSSASLYQYNFNKDIMNYCWKFFLETEIHRTISKKYSATKDKNTVVTGYPGLDALLDKKYQPKQVWKYQEKEKKRIIWAPHHTIPGHHMPLDYATFLDYADFMFEVAQQYQDQIQIAFKPHPMLRGKLKDAKVWGEEKTNAYFKKWQYLPNGQLEEGAYIDLFLTSDAMIHDCCSFLVEYLCTHKPVLYLVNNEKSRQQYNEIGKMALETMDLGYTKEDIRNFINNSVIGKQDSQKEKREAFFNQWVLPPNNRSASENIYHYLLEELKE